MHAYVRHVFDNATETKASSISCTWPVKQSSTVTQAGTVDIVDAPLFVFSEVSLVSTVVGEAHLFCRSVECVDLRGWKAAAGTEKGLPGLVGHGDLSYSVSAVPGKRKPA